MGLPLFAQRQADSPLCRLTSTAEENGFEDLEIAPDNPYGIKTLADVENYYKALPAEAQQQLTSAVQRHAEFLDTNIANVTVSSETRTQDVQKINDNQPTDPDRVQAPEAKAQEINTFSIRVEGAYFQEDPAEILKEMTGLSLRDLAERYRLPGIDEWFLKSFEKQIDDRVENSLASYWREKNDEVEKLAGLSERELSEWIKERQSEQSGCQFGTDPTQHPSFARSRVLNTKLCYGALPFIPLNDPVIRAAGRPWVEDGNFKGYTVNLPTGDQPQLFNAPLVPGTRFVVNPVYFNVLEGTPDPWNEWVNTLGAQTT